MEKRDRCAHSGRNLTGKLHRLFDEFLSAGANEETLQLFAFTDCHQHWWLDRLDDFVCSLRTPVMSGCAGPSRADDHQIVPAARCLMKNLTDRFAALYDDVRLLILCS